MKISLTVRKKDDLSPVAEMVFEESTLLAFASTGLKTLLTPDNEILLVRAD